MILHGIEYQRPTSLNMRILADHVTYSFLAFMKSIFHFCLGCYCGGYSQNGRSNLSSLTIITVSKYCCLHDKNFLGNHKCTASHYILWDNTCFVTLLQGVLTQLIQCYHRFTQVLQRQPFANMPVRNELINIHNVMVEVRKHKQLSDLMSIQKKH